MPSRKWRDDLFAEGETDRPWSAGDNVQLAIGQGDLQTNPLQMAIAYAALGNGGRIVTPHVGMEVEDAAGRVLHEFKPPARRKVKIDPTYRAAIMEGLHDAAQAPGGTSYAVFGGFPVAVAGQDRDGGTAGSRRPVLVRNPRPLSESPDRHRRLPSRKAGSEPKPPRPQRCRSSKPISTSRPPKPPAANGGSPG